MFLFVFDVMCFGNFWKEERKYGGREKVREVKKGINMCLVIFFYGNYIIYIIKGMLLLVYFISCDVFFFFLEFK